MIDGATAAYGLHLAFWGVALIALTGIPVEISWRLCRLNFARRSANDRYRQASLHFGTLLAVPMAALAGVSAVHVSLGPSFSRAAGARFAPTILPNDLVLQIVLLLFAVGAAGMLAWFLVQFLRQRALKMQRAPIWLAEEIAGLSKRLGTKVNVIAMVGPVSVPAVVGVLQPKLIVSRAFMALPASERDAILLHELAHIVRRDVLCNLLQRLVLTLIWFQPVAWKMYRRLAAEREACCDRLAVEAGASRSSLAKALLRFSAPDSFSNLAMGATGHGGLQWRLNRLVSASEPNDAQRWPAVVVYAAALLVSIAVGYRLADTDAGLKDLYVSSVFGPVVEVSARDPAGDFALRIRQGHVIGASVEQRELPTDAIRQDGKVVALLDSSAKTIVNVNVSRDGRIAWEARPPK